MRTAWRERDERPGWDVRYTVIGGRLSDDPLRDVPARLSQVSSRAASQVMIAASPPLGPASKSVAYWASVVRKVVQRGTRPTIHHRDAEQFRIVQPAFDQIQAALSGPIGQSWELDASIELHSTFEVPFWRILGERAPDLRRWFTPQASLEAIADRADAGTERWVDFLLYIPWIVKAGVIEIDGGGHERSLGVDRERDRLIGAAKVSVQRIPGPDVADPNNALMRRLTGGLRPDWLGMADPALVATIHGPAAVHRLAYSIAEAVERGFLTPGREWNLALVDDTGMAERCPNIALDLLGSIAEAWNLDIVPAEVIVNGGVWKRDQQGRFQRASRMSTDQPDVRIELSAFIPPHASLPNSDTPTIVMRGCLVPVDLPWTETTSTERRNRASQTASIAALRRLVTDLYGFDDFREGQAEAVSRILSGGDACVLLPTGAGKSLIYQMAGLLRPGVTLVIAPLKALIDDQERRLHEVGIDRVAGLHSGKPFNKHERRELQAAIGHGDCIVVLVAPERLQIEEFRAQIGEAASSHLVNLAVVDEAHCVSEWGHQFRTSYLKLGRNLRRFCADLNDHPPPLLALTATASPRVLSDMMWELGLDPNEPGLMHRPNNFDRPNLHYRVFPTSDSDRRTQVAEAFDWIAGELNVEPAALGTPQADGTLAGIVFVPHAKSGLDLGLDTYTDVVARTLKLERANAIAQYAGGPPNKSMGGKDWERQKTEMANDFRTNKRPVMISTNAFGMGIDKPNIRYTVHAVMPSSIEGFAQESGRAGRDQGDSYCALVAPAEAPTDPLRIDNRKDENLAFAKDDIGIQLGFLRQSFPELDGEIEAASAIARELLSTGRPGSTVVIPRSKSRTESSSGGRDASASTNERTLFRLMLIGVVDDYTIGYGADTFTVHLNPFDEISLRTTTKDFIRRASGGNRTLADKVDALIGETINELITAHLKLVIDVVFDRVEPARAQALREMLLLSYVTDGERLRERINAYLGEGPVASLLDKLVRSETGILETLEALSRNPPDELEWTGASTRYLESYPDHPVLLAVRALGEAWKVDGSRTEFGRLANEYAAALCTFSLDPHEVSKLTAWTFEHLRTYFDGRRWDWSLDLWDAVESVAIPDDVLQTAENDVLDHAANSQLHPGELFIVLNRRTSRALALGAGIVHHHKMPVRNR